MLSHFKSLLKWLLDPPPRVINPEKIQRSRLLSAILAMLLLLGLAILTSVIRNDPTDLYAPEVQGAILLLGIVAGMFVANKLGYNRYAAGGVIFPFTIIFTYIAFSAGGKSVFLAFLMIPILLTTIFFSMRWTILFAVSLLFVLLVLLSFQDQTSSTSPFWTLRSMWFFLLLTTGLLLTFIWHLSNLEKIRQQELKRINDQLEQQVAELERFNYTVSHELKTPLVTIKGFLGSIESDIRVGKFENVKNDFARITRAADHMHATLSDLLALSRAGRRMNPFSEFPLPELVQEAIESAGGAIESHHMSLKVDPNLPVVYGDRKSLREVFENLIENAAKYMGNQKEPLLEIGVRAGLEPILFVRDNGMGIEPKYHAKIFGLFEKLNPNSEGTGIGLAIIKRIIETHGGRIWVESDGLGTGSTFCFTIPNHRTADNPGDTQVK